MHILRLSILWSFGSLLFAADAQVKGPTATADPAALVGERILSAKRPIDMKYPHGWRPIPNDRYGWFAYKSLSLAKVYNGSNYALLLQQQLEEKSQHGFVQVLIADAISIDNPADYQKFSPHCSDEKLGGNIVAEVRFNNRCDLETTNIKRAWRINLENGKFEKIIDISRLICFFGYSSDLDRDIRRDCQF